MLMRTEKLPTLPELLRQTKEEIEPEEITAPASQAPIHFLEDDTSSEQEQPIEPAQESNTTQVHNSTAKPLSEIFDVSQNDTLKAVWEQALLQHYKSKILGK
jgi:hypothetical protein